MATDERARILEFWRSVEMLSPRRVDPVDPSGDNPVYAWSDAAAAPWSEEHPLGAKPIGDKQAWAHRVYCSVYPFAPVRDRVVERLGGQVDVERFGDLDACLFAFLVNEDGLPLADSFVLMSAAWGGSRALSPGPSDPGWLDGFEAAMERARTAWKMAVLADDPPQRPAVVEGERGRETRTVGGDGQRGATLAPRAPLTWRQVSAAIRAVSAEMGAAELVVTQEVRVAPIRVSKKDGAAPTDLGQLNSFFLDDLTRVAGEVARGTIGAALTQFLSLEPEAARRAARVDLRRRAQVALDLLDPRQFPQGKWPTKGGHALAYSQQLALNAALGQLRDGSGLFAINGPPGTGKTTLLRDLTAAVVVERAKRLSELEKTADAFERFETWGSERTRRRLPLLRESLRGFELVVASSNNGAVENITQEIPAEGAVDPRWLGEVDYFRDQATRTIGTPAWALVAACLGRKSNRREFVSRCWYSKRTEDRDAPVRPEDEGLDKKLWAWKGAQVDWKAAVKRFRETLAEEEAHRARLSAWHEAFRRIWEAREEIEVADAEAGQAAAELTLSERKLAEVGVARGRLAMELVEVRRREREHALTRGPVLERLWTLGRTDRPWRVAARGLRAERVEIEGELQRLGADELHLTEKCTALRSLRASLERRLSERRTWLERAQQDEPGWPAEDPARERCAPWDDREWNEARVRVFLGALELHRAFIQAEAKSVYQGMRVAIDVLDGKTADLSAERVRGAWAMFHLVVPVSSTTFASFERMFTNMGQESIGWLLIDEAGQAAPQYAAGALWRSRRVVAVGDPQQLEPVVELPDALMEALRGRFDAAPHWVPGPASVQSLADRSARYGMALADEDTPEEEATWVGAPLRAHRRCDEPMFGIANEIAYEGLMIHATPRQNSALPESCWIDAPGAADGGHWIPEQGLALVAALADVVAAGTVPDEIIAVSPFRSVAEKIGRLCARPPYRGVRSGTIHTFQGKEAQVVFLVLGGDPHKLGARRFATERPNLVNVAVTRARRRLYVIGDRASWSGLRQFDVLAARLPVRAGLRSS